MLRLAVLVALIAPAPAFAATTQIAKGTLQVGFIVTGSASRSPTVRAAAAAIMGKPVTSRTTVTCDGESCVKTIYY